MASDPEVLEETTVTDQGMVTVPADVRARLDIEPGDKIRWLVNERGDLSIDVVRQRYGAFADDDVTGELDGDSSRLHNLAGGDIEAPD